MFNLTNASVAIGGKMLLSSLTTSFEAGEVTAIIGPNGAGKSTLMKLLSGELRPSTGRILLDGRDLAAFRPRDLALRRAVLAQSNALSFSYTAFEVVRLGLEARRSAGIRSVYDDPREALAAVDLAGFESRAVHELSGGEMQRVHLARVLSQIGAATGPDGARFLLLDEPIASLDIRHQVMVMEVARRFAATGGGVIVVLHDLNMAAGFADRLVVLDRGRLAGDGPPGDVLTAERLAEVFRIGLAVERSQNGELSIRYRPGEQPSGTA